jgi:hypothetical protein
MHASGVETGGMEPESDVKGGKRLCFPYPAARLSQNKSYSHFLRSQLMLTLTNYI